MFLLVKLVIKDKKSPVPMFGIVEKSIEVSNIHNFRPWHRTPSHHGIEGDMIKVNMVECNPDGSEKKRYFEIVNESIDSFTERVNMLKNGQWNNSQKTSL
jgi:hypothetical protein